MRKRITWPLLPAAVSLMALLTFCPLTPVSADKPTIVFIPVDETFLIPGGDNPCGFDIVEHVEGRVKLTLDSDNPHQALFAQGDHLHGTLTNPLNGNSISFVTAERITAVASSDGASVILTITGL